jgi:hypothetical protein
VNIFAFLVVNFYNFEESSVSWLIILVLEFNDQVCQQFLNGLSVVLFEIVYLTDHCLFVIEAELDG